MKKKSIQSYLFRTVLTTVVLISAVIMIINLAVTISVKRDYIYHELEEARDYGNLIVKLEGQMAQVTVFQVTGNSQSYQILPIKIQDQFKHDKEIFDSITTDYFKQEEDEGLIVSRGKNHFYITEESSEGIIIYMVALESMNYFHELLGVFLLITVAIFIASRIISKHISKQVEALSGFSEEIAKKNWDAKVKPIANLELSQLGIALESMKDQLEKADIEERQFLQATSHDLKTPVMIIKGYAQAMIDEIPIEGELPPAEVMLHEAERLERKVNQLVHLNTIGYALDHKERYSDISVDRILRSLAEKMKVVNCELEIRTSLSTLECFGDGETLLIAFENILENQLRYAQSTIEIIIEDRKILISNDGPPFDQSSEELFEIYKKGKSGQFGLGLAITKKVITSHGGTIKAYNTDNGVCFEIIL